MSLLGEDGKGFELARKLETLGVWRAWLGDSFYSSFVHFLSSPSAWDSFMGCTQPRSTNKAQIHLPLQLRARALLFDKAALSLFTSSTPASATTATLISRLNPNYLQLHGDDVYFTLEDGEQRRDGTTPAPPSKGLSKSAFSIASRYGETEMDNLQQKFRNEDLPETWYDQFIDKSKVTRQYRLSLGDRDSEKRTPEEMSTYLRIARKHKRRRVAFKQDQNMGYGNSAVESSSNMHSSNVLDAGSSIDEEVSFFPETMFAWNCVPDSALPSIVHLEDNNKAEVLGVLDMLPQTRSQVRIERLGIFVEGGSSNCGKNSSEGNRKLLGQEQALQLSQMVVARLLARVGFDSATEVPVEVFSQFLRCHICKLGRTLKILSDSYRRQCSAVELLKMFLQTAGYSNLGSLMELVKDGTRPIGQPTQQQLYGVQSQLQQHNALRMQQQMQIPRQMPMQMQQMGHPQNLVFQHKQQQPLLQQQQMRRRQPSAPRVGMDMDKERPIVQVKLENPPDIPMDTSAFNVLQARHQQIQFHQQQQQQLAAMSNLHAQSNNQLRQLTSSQVPQMQSPNMGMVRAPPVKVEGFQELMGGDTTSKHDSEENKLTSSSSR